MAIESTKSIEVKAMVQSLVPMAHVADVERSVNFYQQIGFEVAQRIVREKSLFWAWMHSGRADVMLVQSARPMKPDAQDVLFYLYAADVVAYRNALGARGIPVGPLNHPEYMPAGEFKIHDPDGYCLLIGQVAENPATRG